MRDKPWLSELGYHHHLPRRGFAATAIIDLISIIAVFGVSIGIYLIFGAH